MCDGTDVRTSPDPGDRFREALHEERTAPRADGDHDLRSLRPLALPRREHPDRGIDQVGRDLLVCDVRRDEVTESQAVTKVGEPGDCSPCLRTLVRGDLADDV